jgi:4'-phosphopantetheinyl transferase
VEVEVWWGRPSRERPWHVELLDAGERARRAALRRPADRARFTIATALLKLVAGRRLGRPAGRIVVDRACDRCGGPHGRPRLPGSGLAVSLSHSGDRALVALTDAPAVGVDVEQIAPVEVEELTRQVLAAGERVTGRPDFFGYWTRKEAVVKATGDGLWMPLTEVVVTPPDRPPRLLRYGDRTDLVACLADLDVGEGYTAALAVLAPGPLRVRPREAGPLLDAPLLDAPLLDDPPATGPDARPSR